MRYVVADMHTAGEPVRIILDGHPPPQGPTILAKRDDAQRRFQHIRRTLMHEPRGHADMYGALLVEPTAPGADLAVLFMHHSGYSTMCGHATIALGRWAVENGLVKVTRPVTRFGLECPCGVVMVEVDIGDDGATGMVAFESVPAYAEALDIEIAIPGRATVRADIGFGGAFYAVLPASRLGMDLVATPIDRLRAVAMAVTDTVRSGFRIEVPDAPELAFLYGTILTDDAVPGRDPVTANLCVFGEGQIDRSPTGSGVAARLAIARARVEIGIGEGWRFRGPSGGEFGGDIVREAATAARPAIVARVSGQAFHLGRAEIVVEDDDPLAQGLETLVFRQSFFG